MSNKQNKMKKIFNDGFVFTAILINVCLIYLHNFNAFNPYYYVIDAIDIAFTLYFTVEIIYKIIHTENSNSKSRFKIYISNTWNAIDFISVMLALPSIGIIFINDLEFLSGFTILRAFRIFKFLRIIEYIPDGKRISIQLFKALKAVAFIIFAFLIYSTVISILSVSIFKNYAPHYFSNTFNSFYTIFKIFSGDGFSDVVAEIEANCTATFGYFTKFYFVFIVFTGSILGLSLINSIFIDQMNQFKNTTDSNQNEVEINKLKNEISEIKSLQEKILKKLEKE